MFTEIYPATKKISKGSVQTLSVNLENDIAANRLEEVILLADAKEINKMCNCILS